MIEVQRAAEDGLRAERAAGFVEAAIAEDANVVGAAVGFDAVVGHVVNVVVVEIDRDGDAVAQFVLGDVPSGSP